MLALFHDGMFTDKADIVMGSVAEGLVRRRAAAVVAEQYGREEPSVLADLLTLCSALLERGLLAVQVAP